ncbi:MAG: hypothetical protein OSJ70_03335 [Bacilli bacterium]|nr:hypothetical protein [Bacilli bacterium]
MKSNKKIVIGVVTISLILLIILNTTLPKFEDLSLDEIKERIKKTEKIYICTIRESLTVPCTKSERIKTIDEEEDVKKIVDITINDGEKPQVVTLMGNGRTIYFMDKNDNVIISGEGFNTYYLRTKNKEYEMDLSRIEELRELVGYPSFEEK